jgi:hypothetical protein
VLDEPHTEPEAGNLLVMSACPEAEFMSHDRPLIQDLFSLPSLLDARIGSSGNLDPQ